MSTCNIALWVLVVDEYMRAACLLQMMHMCNVRACAMSTSRLLLCQCSNSALTLTGGAHVLTIALRVQEVVWARSIFKAAR